MDRTKYSAPMFDIVEVELERGFTESYGAEGEAGQTMHIFEYTDAF